MNDHAGGEGPMPYWPAALNKKMAAAYCGLSVDVFQKVCPLKPISFTASNRGERYLRQRIDEWLLSLDPNKTVQVKLEDFFGNEPRKARFGDKITAEPERKRRRRSTGGN